MGVQKYNFIFYPDHVHWGLRSSVSINDILDKSITFRSIAVQKHHWQSHTTAKSQNDPDGIPSPEKGMKSQHSFKETIPYNYKSKPAPIGMKLSITVTRLQISF